MEADIPKEAYFNKDNLGLPTSKWSTIDSAPKDGSLVMLGSIEDDVETVTMGRYYPLEPDQIDAMGHDAGWMDVEFDVYFPSRSFGNPKYYSKGNQPTYWRVLPQLNVQGDK